MRQNKHNEEFEETYDEISTLKAKQSFEDSNCPGSIKIVSGLDGLQIEIKVAIRIALTSSRILSD